MDKVFFLSSLYSHADMGVELERYLKVVKWLEIRSISALLLCLYLSVNQFFLYEKHFKNLTKELSEMTSVYHETEI